MAKQGMARPDWTKTHSRNTSSPVPALQGKAKSGKARAKPIVAGTMGAETKVWHEKPIPENIYPAIDSDLARDNLENDMTDADRQDLNG